MLVNGRGPHVRKTYYAWEPPVFHAKGGEPRDPLAIERGGAPKRLGQVPGLIGFDSTSGRAGCPVRPLVRAIRLRLEGSADTTDAHASSLFLAPNGLLPASQELTSSSEPKEHTDRSVDHDAIESDAVAAPQSDVRANLLEKAMAILFAERGRSGQPLQQSSLERVYSLLKLQPAEILQVAKDAEAAGLMGPAQVDDSDAADDTAESDDGEQQLQPASLLDRLLHHELLDAEHERQLGRAVQRGRMFEAQVANGQLLETPEVLREKASGRKAREALVLANIRLAKDVARRYAGSDLDVDDLLQEGVSGIIRAAESYDPDLGFRFTTYATWWVKQSILRAIGNTGRAIRLPVHRVDQLNVLRRTARRIRSQAPDRRVRPQQIADELGWPIDKVGKLMVLEAESFVPLDMSDGERQSIIDQLASCEPTPEALAIEADFERFMSEWISGLPNREADILRQRFGLDGRDPVTLESVGKQYDLTRERIRQLESKSLKKLGHPANKMAAEGRGFLDDWS